MAKRAAEWLVTDPGGLYWDATVGAGGHAREIAGRLTTGKLFGSDRDPKALLLAESALAGAPVNLVKARFSQLPDVWRDLNVSKLSGVLFDFGIGSFQLDDPDRGLSFDQDGPLDMRMGPDSEPVGAWLNTASEVEIAEVIAEFGEERRARGVARAIVRARPLATTHQLRDVIAHATPPAGRTKSFARVFQALRIRTNEELEEIEQGLGAMQELLALGGRVVAIAYHSLEDRRVKHFFRDQSRDCLCPPAFPECRCNHRAWLKVLTRHAEVPDEFEIRANPRARSARLRVAERLV
jgi:16S rRNA (cytosine1402-N4)-methyltransferase